MIGGPLRHAHVQAKPSVRAADEEREQREDDPADDEDDQSEGEREPGGRFRIEPGRKPQRRQACPVSRARQPRGSGGDEYAGERRNDD